MPHRVGGLDLPAPPPARDESVGDPALDVIADFLRTMLEKWLGAAWRAVAPGEPIVKTVYKHDPGEVDFFDGDLPLLCVWSDDDSSPSRLADAFLENQDQLRVLWMPPPAPQIKGSLRFPFFRPFKKAISLAVQHSRDPAWIHPSDIGDPGAIAYGSDVLAKAGVSHWRLGRFQRIDVQVPNGNETIRYPAYLATLQLSELSETDSTAFGVAPTVIRADLVTGDDPALTESQLKVPTVPDP